MLTRAPAHASVFSSRYEHQNEIEESVVLIYDPVLAEQGQMSICAFRLTDNFMKTCVYVDCEARGRGEWNARCASPYHSPLAQH